MLTRICTTAAAIALISVLISIGISISNQSLRQQVNDRQQLISQGQAYSQLNARLANALAQVANRDNDEKIRKLLDDNGIAIRADQTSQPSAVSK
jgi:hypothetical protein